MYPPDTVRPDRPRGPPAAAPDRPGAGWVWIFLVFLGVLLLTVPLAAEPGTAADRANLTAATEPPLVATLPTEHLRVLGMQAIAAQRHDVALMLAQALRRRDPGDSFAHFLEAQAFLRAGQPDRARAPARRAFANAETPVQKHEAARLAAAAAAQTESYLPAQLWMRRALQAAPNTRARARAADEFVFVRNQAKLLLDLGFSIAPSDNVNGGASNEVFVVDGIDTVGRLSPDAMALSGALTRAHAAVSYRLHRGPTSETRLRGLMQVQWVTLSPQAEEDAPRADAADYGYTVFDAGIDQYLRPWGRQGLRIKLSAYAGQGWFGGLHEYDTLRGDVALRYPFTPRTLASLSYARQVQMDAEGDADDIVTDTWRLGILHRFGNADRVALTLFAGETETPDPRLARTLKGATLRYARADPVGPVTLAGVLSASEADYAHYPWLFGIKVPGGRQDTRLRAALEIGLDRFSYMGFIPTVSVSHERTASNVSRFETRSTAVSLGFRSEF